MDTTPFRTKLEQELAVVEQELQQLGRKNPANPNDWEPTPGEHEQEPADDLDKGSEIEQYEERTAIVKTLEERWGEIKAALDRIGKGTYGTCEISGEPIEPERLEANPAARTCIKHKEAIL